MYQYKWIGLYRFEKVIGLAEEENYLFKKANSSRTFDSTAIELESKDEWDLLFSRGLL